VQSLSTCWFLNVIDTCTWIHRAIAAWREIRSSKVKRSLTDCVAAT
jgi:hypothetical protein